MFTISIFGHGAVGTSIGSLLINASGNEARINFYSPNKNIGSLIPVNVSYNGKTTNIDSSFFNNDKLTRQTNIFLVCLKLNEIITGSNQLFAKIPKDSIILIVSNGLENSQLIKEFVPKNKVIDCILYISCLKKNNIVKNYTLNPRIIIDSKFKDNPILQSNEFKSVFANAGFIIEYSTSFRWEAWRKLIITSSINGACIFFDCNPKEIFTNSEKSFFLKLLLDEGAKVAESIGLLFNKKNITTMFDDILLMPNNCLPSMYYDFKNYKKTEVNFLNGRIVQTAFLNGINVPLNAQIINKIPT